MRPIQLACAEGRPQQRHVRRACDELRNSIRLVSKAPSCIYRGAGRPGKAGQVPPLRRFALASRRMAGLAIAGSEPRVPLADVGAAGAGAAPQEGALGCGAVQQYRSTRDGALPSAERAHCPARAVAQPTSSSGIWKEMRAASG